MTVVAKLKVHEEFGIRRFLYPVTVELPAKELNKDLLAVNDEFGNLLPAEAFAVRSKILLTVAMSLAPFETRKLTVVESEQKAPIPDAISCGADADGLIWNRQEHVATKLSDYLDLQSVVYDGVEHLASPVKFKLNGLDADTERYSRQTRQGALSFLAVAKRLYGEDACVALTDVSLTACKSWVNMTHEVRQPPACSLISLSIPLTPGGDGEVPICDFGLGNGSYSKIDGDAVALESVRPGRKFYWQIGRENEGINRIDYQGEVRSAQSFGQKLWFHWTVGNRSLAVAITSLPKDWAHLKVRLGRTGLIEITAALGNNPPKRAQLGACLHFLNAVPPIAAATNPASILCPPTVTVKIST